MSFHTADEVYLHKMCTLCRYVSACLYNVYSVIVCVYNIFVEASILQPLSEGIVSPNWRSIFAWAFLQTTFLPWSRQNTGCHCTSVKSECLSYCSLALPDLSLYTTFTLCQSRGIAHNNSARDGKSPSWLFDFVKAMWTLQNSSIFLVNTDRKWVQETFCTWLIKFSKRGNFPVGL